MTNNKNEIAKVVMKFLSENRKRSRTSLDYKDAYRSDYYLITDHFTELHSLEKEFGEMPTGDTCPREFGDWLHTIIVAGGGQ